MSGLMTGGMAGAATPSISQGLMQTVIDAMSCAWKILMDDVNNNRFTLAGAHEDTITHHLHMILGKMDADPDRYVPGLSCFQTPIREGNIANFDASHCDKQPDLTFRPVRGFIPGITNSVPVAVFVECKPIDQRHPLGSKYCDEGLIRFVNGDYAPEVDRGLMVGYVRNVCFLHEPLARVLGMMPHCVRLATDGTLVEQPRTMNNESVYLSKHDRTFTVPGKLTTAGKISISHLWLRPETPCESSACQGNIKLAD